MQMFLDNVSVTGFEMIHPRLAHTTLLPVHVLDIFYAQPFEAISNARLQQTIDFAAVDDRCLSAIDWLNIAMKDDSLWRRLHIRKFVVQRDSILRREFGRCVNVIADLGPR